MSPLRTSARPRIGLSSSSAGPLPSAPPAASAGVAIKRAATARRSSPPAADNDPVQRGRSAAVTGPDSHRPLSPDATGRSFGCHCGRPVFFDDSECRDCRAALGYDPARGEVMPLSPLPSTSLRGPGSPAGPDTPSATAGTVWRAAEGIGTDGSRFYRCSNFETEAACNWLVDVADRHAGTPPLCRCCRLNRTLPDLSLDDAAAWWRSIEAAKRRLVASLIKLGLPVQSRAEDPERGLAFDLLRSEPGGPPVVTGYADGVITIDLEEADDAWRQQRRTSMAEPCRTLLGDLRHEAGHYYWWRLVEHSRWIGPWRALFGDERKDHAVAMQRHGQSGALADWSQRFVSTYAGSHPLEDGAETWCHYLRLVDTLDTAHGFGLDGERVDLQQERWGPDAVSGSGDPQSHEFLRLVNGWVEITGMLDGLARSMGLPAFHLGVLSRTAVRKLHLVHRVVTEAARSA